MYNIYICIIYMYLVWDTVVHPFGSVLGLQSNDCWFEDDEIEDDEMTPRKDPGPWTTA